MTCSQVISQWNSMFVPFPGKLKSHEIVKPRSGFQCARRLMQTFPPLRTSSHLSCARVAFLLSTERGRSWRSWRSWFCKVQRLPWVHSGVGLLWFEDIWRVQKRRFVDKGRVFGTLGKPCIGGSLSHCFPDLFYWSSPGGMLLNAFNLLCNFP